MSDEKPIDAYAIVRAEFKNLGYRKEKNDELFYGIRRSRHPEWIGWTRIDDLKQLRANIDQFQNDGVLSMHALNFIYDAFVGQDLSGTDVDSARAGLYDFLSKPTTAISIPPKTTTLDNQPTQTKGVSSWRKQK